MCTSKRLPPVREVLNAQSATQMVGCVSAWIPCTGVDVVRVAWSVRALSGAISVEPVVQFAKVRTDRPEDWASLGATARTTEGDSSWSADVSASSDDFFYMRFGLRYSSSQGTEGHADCRLDPSYKCLGEPVANATLDLDTAEATTRIVAITGALTAVGIAKAKAAFLLTGAKNLRYTLAVRTFDADDEEGGAWAIVGGGLHDPTSDDYDEWVFADAALTLTGKMYFQLGVAFDGGVAGDGYGRLTVLAAVRG